MSNKSPKSRMTVHARWRPLSDTELQNGATNALLFAQKFRKLSALSPAKNCEKGLLSIKVARSDGHHTTRESSSWTSPASFTNIFDPTDNNERVFEAVVAPALLNVLSGQNFSVFAYGHSGSGKTHTIIGDNSPIDTGPGICLAAAKHLFDSLGCLNGPFAAESDDLGRQQQQLGIGLSVFELRRNTAIDLLSRPNPTECHIRQGPDGKTHIRGQTEILEDGKVRVKPLTQKPCWNFVTLQNLLKEGLSYRSVGSSSVHDQSSRTHAIIELEVITHELIAAREALWDRQSELVPVGKKATDIAIEEQSKGVTRTDDGKWVPNPEYVVNQHRIDEANAEKEKFEARITEAEQHIEDVLQSGRDQVSPSLGAKLAFVDLAGAEYHIEAGGAKIQGAIKQTPQERQEGRQINTDLLALKEVIRAWSRNQPRVPYRSSPLTMVLREHFQGDSTGGSDDKSRSRSRSEKHEGAGSCSAMVVTVSPAANQYLPTLNTLKYGSLVGAASV